MKTEMFDYVSQTVDENAHEATLKISKTAMELGVIFQKGDGSYMG